MSETPKSGTSTEADELRRLRKLLLGDRFAYLDTIFRRIEDPEERTEDVAEVLPGALETVVADPVMQPKIDRPLVETIRGAIQRDTESFAEALFPVLGPAIRRAVADALKSLVERINAALEHSFTMKGLRWRLESARSGVPFAQIVLRETMLYAVQEIFLIQPRSGLVLAKARRADTLALDEDAFSAMLTAIQAFIQDSLQVPEGDRLRSAELGDRTLWVINGPQAVIACLVIGTPPREVRDELMRGLETIHARFGHEIDGPAEQLSDRTGIEALLEQMLLGEVAAGRTHSTTRRAPVMWIAAGLLLLALLGWGAWNTWHLHRQQTVIAELLKAEPGYVLTAHDSTGNELHFYGLRDPLSRTPETVLTDAGQAVGELFFSFQPYQSLEPEIVLRRLRQALGGDGVTLELNGDTLTVMGTLSPARRAALEQLPGLHPAVAAVDLSGTGLDGESAAALARRELNATPDVMITPVKGHLAVSGTDADWYAAVAGNTDPIGGWPLDYSPMRDILTQRMESLGNAVNGSEIMFDRLYQLTTASQDGLDRLAVKLTDLMELSSALDVPLVVRLVGFADGLGNSTRNQEIALGRAEKVREEMGRRGVDPSRFRVASDTWQSGRTDPALRKVELRVLWELTP